ncbi:MAG: molybdate ABC transporter substrate-binding protein [Pseudolysinimonas sp.]|uniref:molybdate ABC transporter substrate-binding protein n=1 Tax=Pseudolysinimonas sp. TaxID=2680009 RepID=UPI003266FDA4
MKRFLPVAAMVALLAGCSTPTATPTESITPDALTGTVTVLAAASLTGSLDDVVTAFEALHPNVKVTISYGGSSALAAQIVAGSPADVFFSANDSTMKTVTDAGLTVAPTVVLENVLEIAVPAGNPGKVTGLSDFANSDLTIALCDPAVPCGSAAAKLFTLVGITPSVDTLEEDVKAALTKVSLGEVDAALVYVTDVKVAGDKVEGIEIPEAQQVINEYPISLLTDSANPDAAQAFIDYLRSAAGVKVFVDAGFEAP